MNISEGDIAERVNSRVYSRCTREEAYVNVIARLLNEKEKKEYLDEGEWMEIER